MELEAQRRWDSVGPQQGALGTALFGCPPDVRETILGLFNRPVTNTTYVEWDEESEDFSDDSE